MKNLFLILMILLSKQSFGQITLDNTFNTGIINYSPSTQYDFEFILPQYLSSGLKYFKIKNSSNILNVYNSDYTFHSTITLPVDSAYKMESNWHFSDKLFDLDDEIEIISWTYPFFKIYNQDASLLFAADSCYPITLNYSNEFVLGSFPNFIYFSDSDSTFKMALREINRTANTSNIKIFSLPGTLPGVSCCCNQGLAGIQENNAGFSGMQVYPNPSQGFNIVHLPENISNGEIIVFNMHGDEIKHIPIPPNSKEIEINNSLLPSGTYFYKLSTNNLKYNNSSKKILIVK